VVGQAFTADAFPWAGVIGAIAVVHVLFFFAFHRLLLDLNILNANRIRLRSLGGVLHNSMALDKSIHKNINLDSFVPIIRLERMRVRTVNEDVIWNRTDETQQHGKWKRAF
jgi:hypothetical protein